VDHANKRIEMERSPNLAPRWAEEYPNVIQHELLRGVEILPLSDVIKTDAIYALTVISGLILTSEEYKGPLSNKLKLNIGRPLDEVEYGGKFLRLVETRRLHALSYQITVSGFIFSVKAPRFEELDNEL
jgi:hypothetical protein